MNIETVQAITAGLAIVGLVNGFRLLKEGVDSGPKKNFWGFFFFILALISGIVFGALRWFNLPSVEAGFIAGLVSSGGYRGLEKAGGQ